MLMLLTCILYHYVSLCFILYLFYSIFIKKTTHMQKISNKMFTFAVNSYMFNKNIIL